MNFEGEPMNIEKVFATVDEMNSPLPTIVHELENQGYKVKLEGLEVTANDLDANLFVDLEKATNEFEIEIVKEGEKSQKFKLVFTDYHDFIFKRS
jgi:YbbR domain-containing protein